MCERSAISRQLSARTRRTQVSGTPRDFRNLKVWEKAHATTLGCYQATRVFPREETFGLSSQIRRSAASVPANIAEGCGRGGNELPRFCRIALGSASELEYHLILAHDLELLTRESFERLSTQVIEVKRMLSSFIDRIVADS
jgi:four helix bundle protein